jgi:tRNA modification GTPase
VPDPVARRATFVRFRDPAAGDAIDGGLALWFPAPASFTGEDVAELHLHGSRAVVDAMMRVLSRLPNCRIAEPGEFTRRAFLNGKLDLTAAEGLADLVAAETEAQRRQALRQLDGELGRLYESWRATLMRALAHVEAAIDFPEEDLPAEITGEAASAVARTLGAIDAHLQDGGRGERVREGIAVAIVGPPNAGKSTLLNALARRDVAITSAIAGTTRDIVEVHLDLGGYPVIVADTAGLRPSDDPIEAEGIRRALRRAEAADLRIAIYDVGKPEERRSIEGLLGPDTIVIANKADLLEAPPLAEDAIIVSVRTGQGMPALLERLRSEVAARFGGAAAGPTRLRHRRALEECAECLRRFDPAALPELAAEDLRLAVRSLGRITGRVGVEDMLDIVFREFCIGK